MSESASAFHLSLSVGDLDRAIVFYSKLLGVAPSKRYPDYAKFELVDPPIVLALEPGRSGSDQRLNHLGIRVAGREAVASATTRLHQEGLDPQALDGVQCCYSRQTKVCVNDPDGNLVEIYTVDEEEGESRAKESAAASSAPEAERLVHDHLVGTALPLPLPYGLGTVDEVRLRGTFNIRMSSEGRRSVLKEARRVLKPGGTLMIHLLVADRPIEKPLPKLPGPAARVEHTPVEADLVRDVESVGFVALRCKRLSHSAVFQFDGAEMRELMLTASKEPEERAGDCRAVYRGPFPKITDERGNTYERGIPRRVAPAALSLLQEAYADQFVFLNEAGEHVSCARPEANR